MKNTLCLTKGTKEQECSAFMYKSKYVLGEVNFKVFNRLTFCYSFLSDIIKVQTLLPTAFRISHTWCDKYLLKRAMHLLFTVFTI